VEASPLTRWLEAMEALDADGAMSTFAPDVSLLMADGSRVHGHDEASRLISGFLGQLRSLSYEVSAQWHVQDTWIAEAQATYELTDHFRTAAVPRAVFARVSEAGIVELRLYGAHERPLAEHRTGEEGMWVGGHWVPPL
jgi:hypothetical protein